MQMFRWIFILFASIGFAANSTNNWSVEWVGPPVKELTGGVKIHGEMVLTVDGEKETLFLTGAGERKQYLGILTTKIFTVASYWDTRNKIDRNRPLDSLSKSPTRVLYAHALTPLPGRLLRSFIEDALVKNKVDIAEPATAKLLSQISIDCPRGSEVFFIAQGSRPQKLLVRSKLKSFEGQGDSVALDFWRIWFGTPLDRGIAELKEALLGD